MDTQIPAPGALIAGKLLVEKVIGTGGMGVVLAARHQELGERFAIKMLRLPAEMDRRAVERLRREARAAARLRGEHVVRVMDVGSLENGAPYIVMEYVAGRTVAQAREASGRVAVATAVDWVLQACEGLAEAHGQNIVHRDIKPSNLLLTVRPDGSPLIKLLDFGIAKSMSVAVSTLTETGGFLGSPLYASPEQARDARGVDHRTDIWSLGVVLYELTTGKLPFPSYTANAALASLALDPPVAPRMVVPELPEALERALLRCLEKEPRNSFASVAELASALEPLGSAAAVGATERVERILNQVGRIASEPTAQADSDSTLDSAYDEPPGASGTAPFVLQAPKPEPARAPSVRRWWPLAAALLLLAVLLAVRGLSGASVAATKAVAVRAAEADAPVPSAAGTAVTPPPVAEPAGAPPPLLEATAAATPSQRPAPTAVARPKPAMPSAAAPAAANDVDDFGPRK